MSKWYNTKGNNSDVVVASKVRLARNVEKIPFPCRMTNEMRKSLCKKIFASIQNSAYAGEFDLIELNSLSDAEKASLYEKGYISRELLNQQSYSALLLSKDESIAVMLCEEDHIRIVVRGEGENLEAVYKKADRLDDVLINSMRIAFSDTLGFLTSNPMHLGTGLKASFILHLPAIDYRGMISALTTMVNKLGFSVKPVLGGNGSFFELANSISLGITEQNAIENLTAICDQIVLQERNLRKELIEYGDFEDKIFRAVGTLKMARKLTVSEFFELISLARLGVGFEDFNLTYEKIGEMIHSLGTASIICASEDKLDSEDANRIRAQYIRDNIE